MKVEKQKFDSLLAKLLKAKPEPRKKIKLGAARVLSLRYLRSEFFVGQDFAAREILKRGIKHGKLIPCDG